MIGSTTDLSGKLALDTNGLGDLQAVGQGRTRRKR